MQRRLGVYALGRSSLQLWFPSELHKEINPMLVGFGQVQVMTSAPNLMLMAVSGCLHSLPANLVVIDVSSRMKGLCHSAQLGEKRYKCKDVITSTYSASRPRLSADLEIEG